MSNAHEPSAEAMGDYYQSLGRFVSYYAMMEGYVFWLLQAEARVSSEVARAVFSGAKTDQAKTFIKRICDAEGRSLDAEISRCFDHLTIISNVRNDLLHHGEDDFHPEASGLAAILTNRRVAMPDRAYSYPVSIADLNALAQDCQSIILSLATRLIQIHSPELEAPPFEPPPWRYKSTPRVRIRPPSR